MDLFTVVAVGIVTLCAVVGAMVGYTMWATALPEEDAPKEGVPRSMTVPASYNPHPLLFVLRGVFCCRVRGPFRRDEKIPSLPPVVMRREMDLDVVKYERFHKHFCPEDSLVEGESGAGLTASAGAPEAGSLPLFVTYPNVAGAVMGIASLVHPENPLPTLPFPVHVRQRIELYREVMVTASKGCRFTVIARPEKLVPTETGLEMHLCFDALDESGKLFSRSTLVGFYKFAGGRRKPVTGSEATKGEAKEESPDVCTLRRRDAADALIPADDATRAVEEVWEVPSGTGAIYAELSGDYNPIHVSPFMANLMGGFRGAIIHGMWTLAKSCAALRRRGLLRPQPTTKHGVFVECSFRSALVMPGKGTFGCWKITPAQGRAATLTGQKTDVGVAEFAVWGQPRKRWGMKDEKLDDVFCHGTVGSCAVPE